MGQLELALNQRALITHGQRSVAGWLCADAPAALGHPEAMLKPLADAPLARIAPGLNQESEQGPH